MSQPRRTICVDCGASMGGQPDDPRPPRWGRHDDCMFLRHDPYRLIEREVTAHNKAIDKEDQATEQGTR